MKKEEKFWVLNLTSVELTILQLAVKKYVSEYRGSTFSNESLEATEELVFNANHRSF